MLRKETTDVVQEVVGKRRYSIMFHYGGEKEMASRSLTIVYFTSEVEEDIEVRELEVIPEVVEELGCYHLVYVSQHFIMEDWVDKRGDQLGIDPDPDEEDIEDVVLGD